MKKSKQKKTIKLRKILTRHGKKIVNDEWPGLHFVNGGNSDNTFWRMISNL